MKKIKYKKI